MVSHTTRLVCYAIPLCPGPSHPDTSIYHLSIYLSLSIYLVLQRVRCLLPPAENGVYCLLGVVVRQACSVLAGRPDAGAAGSRRRPKRHWHRLNGVAVELAGVTAQRDAGRQL